MATRVEFGFYKDSNGNTIYNDITQYVISVSTDRGKQNFLTPFSAGQATVMLQNRNRTFDPLYAGSPYNGQIKPTGGLRITTDGVVKFLGFINDWNLSYSVDGVSTASVSASDAFSLFNNQTFDDTADFPVDELSSVRVGKVLTKMAWPADKRIISLGKNVVIGDTPAEGSDVLSYLQLLELSEGGRLFVDRNGNIVFRSGGDNGYEPAFSYKRYNLSKNPSFEVDNTNWGVSQGSITRSTSAFYVGAASGLVAANSIVYQDYAVSPSSSYTMSFYVKAVSGTPTVSIHSYSGANTGSLTIDGTSSLVANSTDWQRISFTYVSDYTDYAGRMFILTNGAVYVDAVLIEPVATVDDYFDGTVRPANTEFVSYSSTWDI
jgi:hypothetical protein